jgi:hypothetical protein
MAHVVPPTRDDFKRILSGPWIALAWLMRDRPEQLKTMYMNDHASFSIVAALLATISAALLMLSPASFEGRDEGAQWVFVAFASLSLGAEIAAVLVATEMYVHSNAMPPECFVWYLIENTHNGFFREPGLWLTVSFASLSVALTACVYLTWGGLFWLPVAGCLGGALLLGSLLSAPLRWRGYFRGLRHLVKDESDTHMHEHGARAFLGPLAEVKRPAAPWPRPSHFVAAHEAHG